MTVTSTVALDNDSPAADLALLSADELDAAATGMPGAEDNPAGTLAALGLEAAEWVASLCGVSGIEGSTPTLKAEDLVETFRVIGTGPKALILARGFVSAVAVTEDGTALVEHTDFVVSHDAGIVRRLSSDDIVRWPVGKIVVSYTAGFATVPPALKAAAQDYVRMRLSERDRDPLLRSEAVEGLDSVSWRVAGAGEQTFAASARQRLARFIRPVIA